MTALIAVARANDYHLNTEDIAQAAGLTPGRSWGGFISRAQSSSKHQFKRELPLRWSKWDDANSRNIYKLADEDAQIIREWADNHDR